MTKNKKFDIEDCNGFITVLITNDKLDLFETPDVLEGLEAALKEKKYPNSLIDLTQTSIIDSTGIGFLIAVNNILLKNGSMMLITGISDRVAEIFRITKMGSFFKYCSGRAEAEILFAKERG